MATCLNILVVEDNDDLRDSVCDVLAGLGHRVVGLSCAEDFGDQQTPLSIDLLVIDLNLPGEDGLSMAKRMRNLQPGLSIVMITSRGMLSEKLAGYEAGADAYLIKPFSVEELCALIKVVVRRRSAEDQKVVEGQGILRLDVKRFTANGPKARVDLSPVETVVLAALSRANEQRLEYWQLISLIESVASCPSLANLAVRMTRLRKKLVNAGFVGNPLPAQRQLSAYQLCLRVQLLE